MRSLSGLNTQGLQPLSITGYWNWRASVRPSP